MKGGKDAAYKVKATQENEKVLDEKSVAVTDVWVYDKDRSRCYLGIRNKPLKQLAEGD